MKKWIIIDLAVFLLIGILALTFAPDVFSLVITCVMCIVVGVFFARGILKVLQMTEGFRTASAYIGEVRQVTTTSTWATFCQSELIFHNKYLDSLWADYTEKMDKEFPEEVLDSDLEDLINEDVLGLYSWKSVMLQVPGSLTALGLVGTFLGLILGISGIAFSSVDAAISSITMLLAGIETAFYTSIIGVIFSMVFNISYKFAWNALLREMGVFMYDFNKYIISDEDRRKTQLSRSDVDKILECLDRIPKGSDYFFNSSAVTGSNSSALDESTLMTEIWEGLKHDDFLFFIQPRCNLTTKSITGGEALMRWNHSRLGIISPNIFLPTLEKNGYIVKLDCQMWENVCRTVRQWLDQGIKPVPISVNISKTDILVTDVTQVFSDLIKKYEIPLQYIQMEIAEIAYSQCSELARDTEAKLRQAGFHVIINGAKGIYETLSLLAGSDADAIKIDYQMLENKKKKDATAVQQIVDQARKARVKLIASNIENVKQIIFLRKSGFVEGQGFFLYKPVDVKAFEELLQEDK